MEIGIDSYCYNQYFGEVYPNEEAPKTKMRLEDFLNRAAELNIDGISLETCFWEVMDPTQEMSYSKGDVQIPGLAPAKGWTGVIDWVVPENGSFLLKLTVIRSTGFECIEKIMEFRNGLLLSSVK